jgi:hypothetical protein
MQNSLDQIQKEIGRRMKMLEASNVKFMEMHLKWNNKIDTLAAYRLTRNSKPMKPEVQVSRK